MFSVINLYIYIFTLSEVILTGMGIYLLHIFYDLMEMLINLFFSLGRFVSLTWPNISLWYFNWYQHVYFDPGYVSWKYQLNLMEIVKIIQNNLKCHIFKRGKTPPFIMNMSNQGRIQSKISEGVKNFQGLYLLVGKEVS